MKRQGEDITIEEATKIAAVGQDPTLRVEFQKIGPKQFPADSLVNAAEVFEQAEKLIPAFYARGWIVMEFDGPLLLTSDEPVAAGVDSQNPHRPAGVGNADSIFFLSPGLGPAH